MDGLENIGSTKPRTGLDGKLILDATCGSRSIWFDKHCPHAVYCDIRDERHENLWPNSGKTLEIAPDVQCDFTDLPFPDGSFRLVVFDPPHLIKARQTSWLVKKYGRLDEKNWRPMIRDGFRECMRVLKPEGVLIFKWSEHDIPARDLWRCLGRTPLFGHHSGKQAGTFWGVFMKLPGADNEKGGLKCDT